MAKKLITKKAPTRKPARSRKPKTRSYTFADPAAAETVAVAFVDPLLPQIGDDAQPTFRIVLEGKEQIDQPGEVE